VICGPDRLNREILNLIFVDLYLSRGAASVDNDVRQCIRKLIKNGQVKLCVVQLNASLRVCCYILCRKLLSIDSRA